jgi:hypothetical protein
MTSRARAVKSVALRGAIGLHVTLMFGFLHGCGDDDSHAPDGGLPQEWFECTVNSDCVVLPASCCGRCGAPARGDALAIQEESAQAYASRVCSNNQGCPACAPLFIDPTLVATCRSGRCELVDLAEHPASQCAQADDCKLRTPDCCECGGDTSPGRLIGIAASAEREYARLVCDPDQACPECAPVYPSEVTVECNADGVCEAADERLP